MQPRINVITLAVADLDRALAFYRDGLGFASSGVIGTEFRGDDAEADGAVAMFTLDGGLILAVYPRSELAKDAGLAPGPPTAGEFSIGHVVDSRADVDAALAEAKCGRRDRARRAARPPMGHLLGLLPRS